MLLAKLLVRSNQTSTLTPGLLGFSCAGDTVLVTEVWHSALPN